MAFENSNFALTFVAASAIRQYQPVMLVGDLLAASALDNTVMPASQAAGAYIGIARGSAAIGDPVTVDMEPGVAKAVAGASIGAGALLVAGSVNGALVVATAAGAASVIKYVIGKALVNAAAGDVFSVLLSPRQIV